MTSMAAIKRIDGRHKISRLNPTARESISRYRLAVGRNAQTTARQMKAMDAYASTVYADPSAGTRTGGWNRTTATSMKSEKKVIDLNAAIYAFSITSGPPTAVLLNGCVAGSQNYNRIGRKIEVKSIQIRMSIQATTPDTSAYDAICRFIIVYDKTPNGAAATWSNIIQSQNIAGTTSSAVTDMINLDNRDRFIIVRDKLFTLGYQSATVAGQPTTVDYSDYVKCNYETVFNAGSAGTVGDIQSGALLMFFASNNAGYSAYASFRVRFREN